MSKVRLCFVDNLNLQNKIMSRLTEEDLKKTASFLYKATKLLPNNELYTPIRSHMMCKTSEIFELPQNVLHSAKCSVCGIEFKDSLPIQIIQPVKQNNRFMRRLLQRQIQRTKYHFISHKKYCKRIQNKQHLVITCARCNKEYKTEIQVPETNSESESIAVSNRYTKQQKLKLKRLQKKQNRAFAGLNKTAVLSAAQNYKNMQNVTAKQVLLCTDNFIPLNGQTPMKNFHNSPNNKQNKRKTKVFAKVPKKSEELKKMKTVNNLANLLNTAPETRREGSLQTFLTIT